jgi:hypothetical protein
MLLGDPDRLMSCLMERPYELHPTRNAKQRVGSGCSLLDLMTAGPIDSYASGNLVKENKRTEELTEVTTFTVAFQLAFLNQSVQTSLPIPAHAVDAWQGLGIGTSIREILATRALLRIQELQTTRPADILQASPHWPLNGSQ